jgi:hypothetical protein
MNPAEFSNIARSERELWWYRQMREILFRLLDPLASRNARVLGAGCGTSYLSKLLEARYGWKMTRSIWCSGAGVMTVSLQVS